MNANSTLLRSALLAALLAASIGPAMAQPVDTAPADRVVIDTDGRDDGFDWGLLGLLGLLGLIPRRQPTHVVHDANSPPQN